MHVVQSRGTHQKVWRSAKTIHNQTPKQSADSRAKYQTPEPFTGLVRSPIGLVHFTGFQSHLPD
jgi:hypothetical protein